MLPIQVGLQMHEAIQDQVITRAEQTAMLTTVFNSMMGVVVMTSAMVIFYRAIKGNPGRGSNADAAIPIYEVKNDKKVMYHVTSREDVDSILRTGLRAPVFMMNGRETVHGVEESAREIEAEHGPSGDEPGVLLRIELPHDWPLHIDEAFDAPMYLVSESEILPDMITVDNWSWG